MAYLGLILKSFSKYVLIKFKSTYSLWTVGFDKSLVSSSRDPGLGHTWQGNGLKLSEAQYYLSHTFAFLLFFFL